MQELDLFYLGKIDLQLDEHLREEFPKILKEDLGIDLEWIYQEATINEPYYRILGYEIDNKLTETAQIALSLKISEIYNDNVYIMKYEF